MRLVYLGSPSVAVRPLQALHDAGHDLALVVTNPPRRRHRNSEPAPTPVGQRANELGIPVTHEVGDLLDVEAELGVVVAFGHIIGPDLLAYLPMVNLHFSLLPRWRGAAPVERAILAGDDRTGVCVMEVAEGLDTGGVYSCVEVPITAQATAETLRSELVERGTALLVETLAKPLGAPVPQADEGVTYAEKIRGDDLHLVWERDAVELSRVVRVGGAWTTISGRRLKVLEAEPIPSPRPSDDSVCGTIEGDTVICGSGVLRLVRVQPEGKAPMDARAFLNGARLGPNARLGT
jgi:methionyl-tRNA formyltransferase